MKCLALFILILTITGCGGSVSNVNINNIALVQNESSYPSADVELLQNIAKKFYADHTDEYDMLVLWGSFALSPKHSFYLPVKNDVPGIGYKNVGTEFFDDSANFGSQNLQGVVWMGPDWISNSNDATGPASVLGVLAQETGHRWAATLYFVDQLSGETSTQLLSDPYHWAFYLNTGASPMGGNFWNDLGGGSYELLPVDNIEYCELDLYTMGLISAEEVEPIKLLINIKNGDDTETPGTKKLKIARVPVATTVEADVKTITIDEIIAAEGRRERDAGYNARTIRQAWIYVYDDAAGPNNSELTRLSELQSQWKDLFETATGGRSNMITTLQ